eukprot:TRINITY_DN10135_c0_g1_i1.p1 TRINITY_DN10135_c0_g1~~TRINITY_DN10135_c0_g1_i1.p1  ORF type:complete len:183 (+),score=62.10 TRINITY_DN10135_c0_g1_i1:83-631(+)
MADSPRRCVFCTQEQPRAASRLRGVESATSQAAPQPELVEALQELERLELALVDERQRVAQLEEEKRRLQESHQRGLQELEQGLRENHAADVAALEKMLEQVLLENERLSGQVKAWEVTKLGSVAKVGGEAGRLGAQDIASSLSDCKADEVRSAPGELEDEPETEPKLQRRLSRDDHTLLAP